ncbi:response regulator transcription factor [Anaeromicrobium sediminis]|uniref:Stage 0 sporulation protein A homolog n=1 Tax=Anaeromicrobium sediminis TaxID=1478221 RepID=A0A267ME38_9FIRM|nr:response regulator transcription factor [Anaeromicrobium sediminis]PAB57135.1 DNA-binding response regulator [Anaeromicrobium sediminis]
MKDNRILIVEDEEAIVDLIAYSLKKEEFNVKIANNGVEALKLVDEFKPNLMLLDWMLPDVSGLDICKLVTERNNIHIIILTAKSDISDKVMGLEVGADDYITKPFDMREVIARIKTIFRRMGNIPNKPNYEEQVIQIKDITIFQEERVVKKNDRIVEITPKEYELLVYFYNNRNKAISRTQILDSVWSYEYAGDTRTVDIHVQRLRKKLGINDILQTIFGVGYKMVK